MMKVLQVLKLLMVMELRVLLNKYFVGLADMFF